MSFLLAPRGGNNALQQNPPNGVSEHITTHGSDFYYAICAAMGASALIVFGLMTRRPQNERVFHYLSIALLTTAAIAYYTMGSDLGWAPVIDEFFRERAVVRGTTRQIFYARYIDWYVCYRPTLYRGNLVCANNSYVIGLLQHLYFFWISS